VPATVVSTTAVSALCAASTFAAPAAESASRRASAREAAVSVSCAARRLDPLPALSDTTSHAATSAGAARANAARTIRRRAW
jgi:hypothetical protein